MKMTIGMFILFIGIFFGAQYIVEKEKLPTKFVQLPIGMLLLVITLLLLLSVFVGILTRLTLIPIAVTVLCASVISARFRKGFNQMEKGGKI